jgi:hypothetical protein
MAAVLLGECFQFGDAVGNVFVLPKNPEDVLAEQRLRREIQFHAIP